MRIFVVGATGVIGRPLVRSLKLAGHSVFGTTRDPQKADLLRSLGAEPVVVNAYDAVALAAAIMAARPDAMVHQLTDLSSMDLAATARLRLEGTRNLVEAAKAAGVRRMLTQSIAFAYGPARQPATEDEPLAVDAPEPWNALAVNISQMESIANELPESVILRYGFFYDKDTGFNGDGFMAQALKAGALPANDNVSSFIHVQDAVDATAQALDWPAGIYNVVDDEPVVAHVWVPAVATANGWPIPARTPGLDPIMSRGASNARARELGWTPRHRTWKDGLARVAV